MWYHSKVSEALNMFCAYSRLKCALGTLLATLLLQKVLNTLEFDYCFEFVVRSTSEVILE